ncbi:GNAT family N-acetyltransferase [Limimaricola cinnabarinus]|uniref:Acetyltransferase, GNAT family n=1 Tax=Limimaricola cinnabarinus LL-001 TaxID=1337093 RepID=U3A9X5_9RHOB|nr:GNAT family N-acetyltransferase [Limimaricola cinnabarinus]GAD54464.1 acetyltransferase, GNAT family [Limimaricola cinnabarinus LL-001]
MIRDLGPCDLSEWRRIRTEGLRLFPEAFLTTLREELARSDEEVAESLAGRLVLGVFEDDRLVGTAALDPVVEATATAHRVMLNAFYVSAQRHGTGIGARLLGATLDRAAADGKLQVELFVAAQNAPAIRLYEKHGFVRHGFLPRTARLESGFVDDLYYLRQLDG